MGGQRPRTGQHLYRCLAAFIVIISLGCAHDRPAGPATQPVQQRRAVVRDRQQSRGWNHLQPVQAYVDNRDFDAAIRECQDMLSLAGKDRQADLVLFDLGLLYSHYANPKKDFKRSLLYFSRLVRDYPRSPLLEEAKIWVNLLETMEKAKWVDIELEERKNTLSK